MNDKDRVQYAHSVETGFMDFTTAFTAYFDQLMGIYAVVRPCNYTVEVVDALQNCFVINMKFEDDESSDKAVEVLRQLGEFDIYGNKFSINNITVVSPREIGLNIMY